MDAGTPLTPRVRGASRDVAQGLNGALRANYDGSASTFRPDHRSVLQHLGLLRAADRVSRHVAAQHHHRARIETARWPAVARRRLGGNRALTIQLRATNLLNLVNYPSVDTYVNSPTFGQVLNVRPMRSAQLNLRFRF